MPPHENPVTGFFSWDELGSFTGSVAATVLILRVLAASGIARLERIPMIVQAYILGCLLLIGADYAVPPAPSYQSITLCLVNAFGVAIAAIGANVVLGLPTKHPDGNGAKR